MKALFTAVVVAAFCGLVPGAPARAEEDDCVTVIKDLEEALAIATKNFEVTMDDLKKIISDGADDKKKAAVKNTFCSASGEMLGTSRAMRAVVAVCGPKQRAAIASLDKSIGEMGTAIGNTCK